jgi:hypothetical protein
VSPFALQLAARLVAAHSTVVDHDASAYGTAMRPARYGNSTGVLNVDRVSPSDQQALAAVVNGEAISAAYSTAAGGMSPMALMPASDTSSAQGQQTAAQANAQRDMNPIQRQQVDVAPATAQAAAQSPAVAQGTSADGVSQMALQLPRVPQMALQPPNDVNSALASHRASVVNFAQDYAVAATQTATAAVQATAKVHDTAAEGVSSTSLQPTSDMNSIQRQQVDVAPATAQALAQVVGSLPMQPAGPPNERPTCTIENAAHRQIWNSFQFGDRPLGTPTTVGGNNKRPSVVASVVAQVVAGATAASATDKGSPVDLKPSDQQALAEVLNVDVVSLLASIAAAVVPVAVASAVAQAVAAPAHSTVVDHGASAYGTAMQPARYGNSTDVLNVDRVFPSDQQALAAVV